MVLPVRTPHSSGHVERAEPLRRAGTAGGSPGTIGVLRLFPAQPDTPGLARGLVRSKLTEWGRVPLIDACELTVSELASNAVRHTGCHRISVVVRLEGCAAVIAVGDCSRELPVLLRNYRDEDENGRGLDLIDQISDRWGVQPEACGKTVWARISARL